MSYQIEKLKMPELVVLIKPMLIGMILMETWLTSFSLGSHYAEGMKTFEPCSPLGIGILTTYLFCVFTCIDYCLQRGITNTTVKMVNSKRFDLLATFALGIGVHFQFAASLENFHGEILRRIAEWTPLIFVALFLLPLSSALRPKHRQQNDSVKRRYFLSDEEVDDATKDTLQVKNQAVQFANAVMHSGDVFGLDGPWGVGKTSFINLAASVWSNNDNFIVCRFEPLRYSSEIDLSVRLVQELTASIQSKVYAPELPLAADRYTKIIKGKAEVSYFGFKISLEPSAEGIDDLIKDINNVLERLNRRVIIVIDDLDRLDIKTVNSVLFATKRTLPLTQATYVLCYDTEVLTSGQDESTRAREFLEKFVTIKYSLLLDTSSICNFLRGEWKSLISQDEFTSGEGRKRLEEILEELASLLEGHLSANYLQLIGNMRKVKRFFNALRLMRIEETNLGETDFNKIDLINLTLIHFNFPGLFRKIYMEETGSNIGSFSLKRDSENKEYVNSDDFDKIINQYSNEPSAIFLLKQLFDIKTPLFDKYQEIKEIDLRTRACFNHGNFRTLEAYLKLIVRVVTPEPQKTLIFYTKSLTEIQNGTAISSILERPSFQSENWLHTHRRLWKEIQNQCYELPVKAIDDSINTLIEFLPKYPLVDDDDRGLRKHSILTLIKILSRAGWGSPEKRRSLQDAVQIAWRIFGEQDYSGNSLIEKIVSKSQGPIGWYDLMLFRLYCSADRQGDIHELMTGLILHQDPSAATSGSLHSLTVNEMRVFSQKIFHVFKQEFISNRINFLEVIDNIKYGDITGTVHKTELSVSEKKLLLTEITTIKSFVLYQLSNTFPPEGSGVGCGYYDEIGAGDNKGISVAMNDYLFKVCFNPSLKMTNAIHFFDHCLSHLQTPFYTGDPEGGLVASKDSLLGGLNVKAMGIYWSKHQDQIKKLVSENPTRTVYTSNYYVRYDEIADKVYSALDELAADAQPKAQD